MEIRVFSTEVEPLGAIDEISSLLWVTKYFDVGTFSLLAPITENNSKLLKRGNIITKHDGRREVVTARYGAGRHRLHTYTLRRMKTAWSSWKHKAIC